MAKATAAKPPASKTVLTLKVTLRNTKPPIWRRVLVPGAMTLGKFHRTIQAVMGWHDSHLHAFDIDGRQYGDPSHTDDVANEKRLTLDGVQKSGIVRFTYTYDFGDNWEHLITIEETRPAIDGETVPACVAGKRAGPPEDCGGTWGYERLLVILADPDHPEHEEQREWAGENLDPEVFDIADANTMLRAMLR